MRFSKHLKITVSFATMAVAVAFFSSGCSQSVVPLIHSNSVLPLETTDWTSPSFVNPLNPYDSIGLIHNLCMDYVYVQLKGSVDTNAAEGYVCQFFQQRWGYNADTLRAFLDTIKFWEKNGISQYSQVTDSLQQLWRADTNFPNYIGDADTIVHDTSLNSDTALTILVRIEDSTVNDPLVTATERQLGLPYLAFVRYSYAYCHSNSINKWPAVSQAHHGRMQPQVTGSGGSSVGSADWTGMAGGACGGFTGGTVVGAYTGFAAGGPLGAVVGGASGGVSGFLLGGLGGGITASLTNALTGGGTSFSGSYLSILVGMFLALF